MIVVNSSRKSSTHRCTTQNRQKSVMVKLRVRVGEQADSVEGRDRQRGEEEEPGHVAHVLAAQRARAARGRGSPPRRTGRCESSTCQNRPRSRYSKPWLPNQVRCGRASRGCRRARRARLPHDHDRQRAEQRVGEPAAGGAARGRRSSGRGRSRRPGTTSTTQRIESWTCQVRARL